MSGSKKAGSPRQRTKSATRGRAVPLSDAPDRAASITADAAKLKSAAELITRALVTLSRDLNTWLVAAGVDVPLPPGYRAGTGDAPTRRRRRSPDALGALVELARSQTSDPNDPHAVWLLLRSEAARGGEEAPIPLYGVTDTTIIWIGPDGGSRELTFEALRERMRRRAG